MNDATIGAGEIAVPVRIETLQLELLAPDPEQPRKFFDEEALEGLAESIRANGVIQPIVARPDGKGGFSIIAGERRFRASQLAGKADIPVVIRDDLVGKDVAVLQILENLQRADLTLSETAAGVAHLVAAVGGREAARQLGKSEAWISKHASVEQLPDAVKQAIGDGVVTSVDMAKDLGRLFELNQREAQGFIEELAEENSSATRDDVRAAVQDAERRKQWAEEDKANKVAEKANPKQPTAQDQKFKQQEEARKAKRSACEKAKKICTEFADHVTVQVNHLAGLPKPKKDRYSGWDHKTPFRCAAPWFNEYDSKAAPASAETATYTIDFSGSYEIAEKVFKITGIDPGKDLGIEIDGIITLAEVKQVVAIFGKRVSLQVGTKVPGKKLQGLVAEALKASTAAPAKTAAKKAPAKKKTNKPAPTKKKGGAKK